MCKESLLNNVHTPEAIEQRRLRVQVSLWAYAYELEDNPIVSDAVFDSTARCIKPEVTTGHPVLDQFFKEHFKAYTGSWIHMHPELEKVSAIYLVLENQHDH
jgi:hypothetical protein